jgi:hypothetical protein
VESIHPFFSWCESSALHDAIQGHEAAYPALETFHLFGLTLLLGTIVILSLRLMGAILKKQPIAELAGELLPYQTTGLILMIVTGSLMVVATAERCYGNTSFWVKMILLACALTYHFGYFRKLVRRDDARISSGGAKFAAIFALLLWFGVGMAGRSIGFFG